MKLYILRHGETEWNTEKRMQGQTNIPLNENGINLAKKIGSHMRNVHFDYIFSSPLDRAVTTAKLITDNRDIPFKTDDRLIEMSFGKWEGCRITDPDAVPSEFNANFVKDPLHCIVPPEGESFMDVITRTGDFLDWLCSVPEYKGADILISTHGAAGRCLLSNFYEDKEDIWRGCVPPNCSICIVEIKDGIKSVLEKDKIF